MRVGEMPIAVYNADGHISSCTLYAPSHLMHTSIHSSSFTLDRHNFVNMLLLPTFDHDGCQFSASYASSVDSHAVLLDA